MNTLNNNKSVSLVKGAKISLTKDNPNLSKIKVALGWNINDGNGENFDLDASVFMLGASGKIQDTTDFVYFNNLNSTNGAVQHTGDNLTGSDEGDNDDEVINVDLKKIPSNIEKLVFTVTIYEALKRKQNFGQVNNAYIRVIDDENDKELLKYDLTEEFSIETALIVSEIYRHGQEWKFSAIGLGMNEEIGGVCRKYGLNV